MVGDNLVGKEVDRDVGDGAGQCILSNSLAKTKKKRRRLAVYVERKGGRGEFVVQSDRTCFLNAIVGEWIRGREQRGGGFEKET